jgi:RNA polymerase sigma factor (sigma-70 family)
VDPAGVVTATDRDLLTRFVAGDDGAFAEVVARHAGLVMGVCRRVLREAADAEDAFQATFLVLARKAGSMAWQDSVAGWLHETARKSALKLRGSIARRVVLEHQAAATLEDPAVTTTNDPAKQVTVRELSELLDDELSRLPARFRDVLLLSCLEGLGRDEVAARLGITAAAVKDRLERGREQLRQRLVRRGVTLSAVSLAAWLLPNTAVAAGSAGLVTGTAQAAGAFAAGKLAAGTLSPAVTLAQGVLHMMGLKKLQLAMGYVAAVVMAGTVAYGMLQDAPRRFEQGLSGEVVEVGSGASRTVTLAVEPHGAWLNLDIANGAKLWTAFEPGQVADLAVGQYVAVRLGDDHRTIEELHVHGPQQEVVVRSTPAGGKLLVQVDEDDDSSPAPTEVELAPDAILRIGGLPATVEDLEPGMTLPLEFGRDGQRVHAIEAGGDERLRLAGILQQIDAEKQELVILRDDGEEEERVTKTYAVTPRTIFVMDQQTLMLEGLRAPADVEVRLAPDGRTIRALRVVRVITEADDP